MGLNLKTVGAASLLALALAAGAQAQTAPPPVPDAPASALDPARVDPWEKTNRGLFLVGGALDVALIRPVAIFYKHATPRPAREGVHNVIANLDEPSAFINHVLQLRPAPAAGTLGRFVLNSTVGIGGLFDVASGAGLPERGTNFGRTLARYGVRRGPYVFVPVLGPSTVRDSAGGVVDIFLDPFFYIRFDGSGYFVGSRAVLAAVDARAAADPALKAITQNATDPYAALRSAYLQNARFMENGGRIDVKALPDFGPEPAAPAGPSPDKPEPGRPQPQ
jgi:phospholipid-binding lipoprotein MlaA